VAIVERWELLSVSVEIIVHRTKLSDLLECREVSCESISVNLQPGELAHLPEYKEVASISQRELFFFSWMSSQDLHACIWTMPVDEL